MRRPSRRAMRRRLEPAEVPATLSCVSSPAHNNVLVLDPAAFLFSLPACVLFEGRPCPQRPEALPIARSPSGREAYTRRAFGMRPNGSFLEL